MTTPLSHSRSRSALAVLLIAALVAACSGDAAAPPVPAELVATRSPAATATVATVAAVAPVVTVRTSTQKPVSGVPVTFTVAGGGTIAVTSATTTSTGEATPGAWTLGNTVGANTVTASAAGLPPVTFTVNTTAGAPATIELAPGNPTTAVVAQTVSAAVKVADQFGNAVTGTAVTFTAQNGTVGTTTATTDASGIARVTNWTLGTTVGAQRLVATTGALSTTLTVTAAAGAAAQFSQLIANTQNGTVGAAVASRPGVRVADAHGNPVGGAVVTFAVLEGNGTLTGAVQTSGSDGMAIVGGWTLGTVAGTNRLSATLSGVATSTVLVANALPGPASRLAVTQGNGQTAAAGTAVTVKPAVQVRDQFDNVIPGVNVTFAVATGGGSLTGATAATSAEGIATVGSWTLGTGAGANSLTASVATVAPLTITATGIPGAPSQVIKSSGEGQSAAVGTAVAIAPTVRVADAFGNGIAGATVTFAVTSGGGSISGGAVKTTNTSGNASVTEWTLGPTAGTNTLSATVSGLPVAVFTATAGGGTTPGGQFDLEVRFTSPVTAAQQAAFDAAAARWESVIVGDLPDIQITAADGFVAGVCGIPHPAVVETVDDLIIFVELKALDGPGGLLGQAGPCYIRDPLPIVGTMQFDVADIDVMLASGTLQPVITHEMGHVLGIGTLWSLFTPALISGGGGLDPFFTGTQGNSAFTLNGGILVNGIPIENCQVGVPASCGSGTRDAHWREAIFRTELMTGYISSGTSPLSRMTIASMEDMGYAVNLGAADAYTLPSPITGLYAAGPSFALNEKLLMPRFRIRD